MSRTALPALLAATGLLFACSSSDPAEVAGPAIAISEPTAGAVLTQRTVRLAGTITPGDSPVTSAEYEVNGERVSLTLGPAGAFSATVTVPELAGEPLALTVRATDEEGRRSEASVQVQVENARPSLTLTSPGPGAVLGPASTTSVTFTGSAVDAVTGAPATLTLDFDDGQGPREVPNAKSGFSFTLPLAEEDWVAHDVQLVATDPRGNTRTLTVPVVVDRVAPQLAVDAPAEGQKFRIADFASGSDVPFHFTMSDGDPGTRVKRQEGADLLPVSGQSVIVTTSPTDDGVTYTVRLRATDEAGNATTVTRSIGVDRVAPTFQFDRQDGTRLTPPSVTLTFSEPVTAAGAPFSLDPAEGVASAPVPFSGSDFAFTGLTGDSTYTASLAAGAVVDAFGNPSEGAQTVTFHTRPAQPAAGSVQTLRSDVLAFDVSSDPDGVVTLLLETTGTGKPMAMFLFDPATGVPASAVITGRPSGTLLHLSAASWSTVQADLSSKRAQGYRMAYSGGLSAIGVAGSSILPAPGDEFVVPVPPGCADDPATGPLGVVTSGYNFTRGFSTESVEVLPDRLLIQGPNDWELVGLEGGVLKAQTRLCACGAVTLCAWQPSRTLSLPGGATPLAEPRLSVTGTAAGERRLYVVDADSGLRTELCQVRCPAGETCPSNASQSTPLAEGLFVASAGSGNAVIGARKGGTGVQLLTRDLQNSCGGAWTVTATAPGSDGATVTQWRPAMFGDRPGLLWLDGSDLKLYIP